MADGLTLGTAEDGLPAVAADHRHPIHCLGIPGVGKSTLLGHISEDACAAGEGVLVIDIKDGRLARDVASRTRFPDRLVYVAPGLAAKSGRSWGLNILDGDPSVVVDNVIDLFERTGSFNPAFMTQVHQFLRMGLWLAKGTPGTTLHDLGRLLTDRTHRGRLLRSPRISPRVRAFWGDFNAQALKSGETSKAQRDAVASTVVRLDEFLVPDLLAALLAEPVSTLDLAGFLDAGRLVVCNLVDGVPPRQTRLLGNLVIAHLVNAALARTVDDASRHWRIVADEFDQLAADPFVHAIDKLRAARVLPVMAHQNLSQLPAELENSLSGAPIKVFFRISGQDKGVVSRRYGGPEAAGMIVLPRHQARVWLSDEADGVDWLPPIPARWQTVATQDWWAAPDGGQLAAAEAAALRRLDADPSPPPEDSHAPDSPARQIEPAPDAAPPADPPRSGAGARGAVPDDPQGDGGAGGARPVPLPHQRTGRRAVVPRPAELDWEDPR